MPARAWLGAALVLALVACASPPVAPDAVSGRLSLSTQGSDGAPAQQFSAAFDLGGSERQGELRLSTALGTTLALARWSPGEVTLQAQGQSKRYAALDALAQDVFGEPLPLPAIFAWLRGVPWQGAAHRVNSAGFDQLGWSVDLTRWSQGVLLAERVSPSAVLLRARVDPRP